MVLYSGGCFFTMKAVVFSLSLFQQLELGHREMKNVHFCILFCDTLALFRVFYMPFEFCGIVFC